MHGMPCSKAWVFKIRNTNADQDDTRMTTVYNQILITSHLLPMSLKSWKLAPIQSCMHLRMAWQGTGRLPPALEVERPLTTESTLEDGGFGGVDSVLLRQWHGLIKEFTFLRRHDSLGNLNSTTSFSGNQPRTTNSSNLFDMINFA